MDQSRGSCRRSTSRGPSNPTSTKSIVAPKQEGKQATNTLEILHRGVNCPADEEIVRNEVSKMYKHIKIGLETSKDEEASMFEQPATNTSFIERMEFDTYRRAVKESKLSQIVDANKKKLNVKEETNLV